MQNLININFSEANLSALSEQELLDLNGGSFWGDAAYVAGATLKCLVVFCKTAAEFQASLPPNLKK